ncbi:hypothetical protein [Kitasatospora sp. NPDC058190]|uniref:hypothetical protein n=1 Tax=Kitasatospora sp. NPDC058190 TaxID=3346371 RepID=UPI0036D8344A
MTDQEITHGPGRTGHPVKPVPKILAILGTIVLASYTGVCVFMLLSFTRECLKGESPVSVVATVMAVAVGGALSGVLLFSAPRMFWSWVMLAVCVGGTAVPTAAMLSEHNGLNDVEGWALLVTLTAVQVGGFFVSGVALLAMWFPRTFDALAMAGGHNIR